MNTKQHISIFLVTLLLTQTACASTRIAVNTAGDLQNQTLSFDPQKNYEIVIINQQKPIRIKGSQIQNQDTRLAIKDSSGNIRQVYTHDQIADIFVVSPANSRKKNTLTGLGIGCGAGFALGMIPVTQFGFKSCTPQTAGDVGDCKTFKKGSYIILPVSTVVFGGVGALVGSLIRAKK